MAAASAAALVTDPAGFDHAFYRGDGDAVYQRSFDDGTWSEAALVGGRIVGAPSATLAGTTVVLAVRDTNGALRLRMSNQGVWGPWLSWGGILTAAPAVVGDGAGQIDVVVRGTDNALWSRSLPSGGALSPWTRLGGVARTGPAGVSPSPGGLDVYVVGTDNAVWRRTRAGSQWSAWQTLGGTTYSAPSAAWNPESATTSVFVRATDNTLVVKQHVSGSWTSWQRLGGVLIDAPAAAGVAGGGLDVVVRGIDNALWSRLHRSGSWSAWSRAWVPAPPPAPAPALLGSDWTRVPTTQPVVALTFDAGGNANGLASILRTLQTRNVPATFYFTGQWARTFPDRANEVAVGGFPIGNHSDTHPDLTTLPDAQVMGQLSTAQAAILRTTGVESRPLFRFPFGAVDSRVLGLVNGMGYVGVRWTVDTLGWQGTSGGMTIQAVVARVLAALQPGEIVLMHVGSHPTDGSTLDAAALPRIIDEIRTRGYRFVTLEALVGP